MNTPQNLWVKKEQGKLLIEQSKNENVPKSIGCKQQISGKYSPLNDNVRLYNPSHLNSHIQILEKSK